MRTFWKPCRANRSRPKLKDFYGSLCRARRKSKSSGSVAAPPEPGKRLQPLPCAHPQPNQGVIEKALSRSLYIIASLTPKIKGETFSKRVLTILSKYDNIRPSKGGTARHTYPRNRREVMANDIDRSPRTPYIVSRCHFRSY